MDSQHPPEEQTFSSYDLGLSGSLITLGYHLVSIDKTNHSKVLFVFRRTSDIDADVARYWDDSLQLRARSMFDNLKMLKNRIHSG